MTTAATHKRKRCNDGDGARDASTSCSICLETLAARSANVGECRHEFCYACIKDWAARENTCPVCRKRFKCIETFADDKDDEKKQIEVVETRNQPVSREPFRFSDAEPGSLAEQTDLMVQRLILLSAEQTMLQRHLADAEARARWQRIHDGRRRARERQRERAVQGGRGEGTRATVIDLARDAATPRTVIDLTAKE